MRHRKKQLKLGSDRDHTKAILRNLATSVILYEKVKTTQTKAKAVAPEVEKMITIAKNCVKKEDQMNAIRRLNALVYDKNASKKLLEELKDRYKDKQSGFTRITNIGFRKGDAATLVQIELT